MSFDYGQGRSFVFRDLIEYGANTFPGDSGSPLVDSTGRLWGMHFYRSAAGLCYAFTAPRMFDGNVFGFFADVAVGGVQNKIIIDLFEMFFNTSNNLANIFGSQRMNEQPDDPCP